ncbi:siderophore-interacting protein [Actinokineospora spheciospongiae]|uniref:siderophore-interacting protein n=1 Tax=Actinokineospora spheciospongiae TaxID=909613 RepID=UPI000D71B759|nr:siderophore-interacting protein [Actinokineospora spheciospongiae]PWW62339.1 NADPH-dependent ferric siderophore reductase [Actinokineospora spheciospongiae]
MAPVSFVHVTAVRRLTPHTTRVTFTGDGLDTLTRWPDQQLKLCFPRPGQSEPRIPAEHPADVMRWYQAFMAIPGPERPWMRSYTVRHLRPGAAEFDVDFVLHDTPGPATEWAAGARVGDTLARYGPARQYARSLPRGDDHLFAGDLAALPAIATLLESLPDPATAQVFIEVPDLSDAQDLPHPITWLPRGSTAPADSTLLLEAVRSAKTTPDTVAWIATEATITRTLRRHLVDRGIPKPRIEFTGYWRHTLTQDDAPTAEDLTDARERVARDG